LSSKALANLEHYYDIELTYTSNAIEGNTLSAVKTALLSIGVIFLYSPASECESLSELAR
jgi:hypothetical protein